MIRRPPKSTRTDTLFPYTTLFRSYSQTPPRDIAGFVRPFMARVFPQVADAAIDYGWGGAVAVTRSRLPHIGRRGNAFFAHGFSGHGRSEEHTSELQSLMRISYAVFCLKKKKHTTQYTNISSS